MSWGEGFPGGGNRILPGAGGSQVCSEQCKKAVRQQLEGQDRRGNGGGRLLRTSLSHGV